MLIPMSTGLVQGGAAVPEYIGSATKSVDNKFGWDSAGEAVDILSFAEEGDLVVYAISTNRELTAFSWNGMAFTEVYAGFTTNFPYYRGGYHFIQSGDSNPYISTTLTIQSAISAVFSVFRGVSTYEGYALSAAAGFTPNPPNLIADGKIWVAAGHSGSNDGTLATAPSGYTLSDAVAAPFKNTQSMQAYLISDEASQDPDAFGAVSNTRNAGVTWAFS